MNVALTASIASLAHATAAYESAWRSSLTAIDADRRDAAKDMQDAYWKQIDALEAVTNAVGVDTARTIHGGLIAAATLVHGERTAPHRDHLITPDDVRGFISQVERAQAGI